MPRPPNAGRKPGSPNKVNKAVKEFLREMVEDPDVQSAFKKQIVAGDRGAMAAFLGSAHLVVGKPTETVNVGVTPDMGALIVMALQEANELEKARKTAKK